MPGLLGRPASGSLSSAGSGSFTLAPAVVDAFKFEVESRRSRAAQELEDARATFRRENEELNQELDRAQAEVSGAAEKGRMMRQQALQLRSKVDNLQMQVRGGMCDPCGRCNERCVLPVCQCIKQRVCEVAEAARWAGEACSGMLLQVGHLEASVLQFSNPTLIKQNVLPPAPSPLLILSIPLPPPPRPAASASTQPSWRSCAAASWRPRRSWRRGEQRRRVAARRLTPPGSGVRWRPWRGGWQPCARNGTGEGPRERAWGVDACSSWRMTCCSFSDHH